MAVFNTSALKSAIYRLIPDNNSRLITPSRIREAFVSLIDAFTSTGISVVLDLTADTIGVLGINKGGTGSTDAPGAREALGVKIGTDVQAHDPDLDVIATLAKVKGNLIVANGTAWDVIAIGSNGQFLVADSTQANGVRWVTFDVPLASETVAGKVELATLAETRSRSPGLAVQAQHIRRYTRPFAIKGTDGVGNYTSSFVSDDNRVYVCGDSGARALGHGDNNEDLMGFVPMLIPQKPIRRVVQSLNSHIVLYEDGEMWAWGQNLQSRFGGTDANWFFPRLVSWPEPVDKFIECFADGNYFVGYGGLLVKGRTTGTWYGMGANTEAQLNGNGNTTSPQTSPMTVPFAYDEVWGSPGQGGLIFARTASKQLYVWGYNYAGTAGNTNTTATAAITTRALVLNVPQNGTEYVVDVKVRTCDDSPAGDQYHRQIHMRTNLGNLYTHGWNDTIYLCGHASAINQSGWVCQPTLLLANVVDSDVINSRFVGGWALLNDGTMRIWGQNNRGTLGLGATTTTSTAPTKPSYLGNNAFFDGKVKKVLSNFNTYDTFWSAILTTDGKVYAAGYNGSGNLGVGTYADTTVYTLLPVCNSVFVSDIFQCGGIHAQGSIGVVTEDGDVYTTGPNGSYAMGRATAFSGNTSAHSRVLIT